MPTRALFFTTPFFITLFASAVSAEAPTPERARVIILPIAPEVGVDESVTKLLDDLLSVSFARFVEIDAISTSDVAELMAHEANKQALGCDDASCMAELAGAIGARYVVSGRIGKLGARYSFTVSLFDSERAVGIGRTNRTGNSLDQIADGIDAQVEETVAPLALTFKAGVGPSRKPAALPPPDPGVSFAGVGVTGGLCAGAVCLNVLAPLFDLIAISMTDSQGAPLAFNGRLDPIDVVAPAVACLGIGLGVAGLFAIPLLWFPEPEDESDPLDDREKRTP